MPERNKPDFSTNEPTRPLNPSVPETPLQDHPTPDNPYGPFRKVPTSVDPNSTEQAPEDGEDLIEQTGEERGAKPTTPEKPAQQTEKGKK